MLSTPPAIQEPAPEMGPPAPRLKHFPKGQTLSAAISASARAMLQDMPGAVVVIEDEAPGPIAMFEKDMRLLRNRLRLGVQTLAVPGTQVVLPNWMNPNITRSGGNTVQQVFPIGGF